VLKQTLQINVFNLLNFSDNFKILTNRVLIARCSCNLGWSWYVDGDANISGRLVVDNKDVVAAFASGNAND
jgi:hypothetical protein